MTEHPYLGVIPGVHTRKAHRQISYDKNRADTCTPLDSAAPKVAKSNGPVLAPAVGSHAIAFTVNGVAHTASAGADLDAHTTLASYLREKLNLTGTKIGCNEGGCGACTVMIGRQDSTTGQITTTLANSCLRPLFSLDGAHVITTEGLGSSAKGFGPVQRKIAECNGTQCGYCTPGFTLAMSGLLATAEQPTAEEVETRFQGNLCRCTGYRSIYEAMHTFAATDEHGQPTAEARALCAEAGADIEDLLREGVRSQCALKGCGNSAASRGCAADGKGGCPNVDADGESGCTNLESATEGGHSTAGACCQHGHEARAHAEPCAPPAAVADGASKMAANGVSWIEPTSLDGALEAVKTCVAAGEAYRLVVGSTSPGVAKYYPSVASDAPTSFIHIARLAELTQVQISASEITFGAAVTLSSVIDSLRTALKGDASASRPARKGAELAGGIGPIGEANLQSAIRHLSLVAHYQVRDVASWAGNLLLAKQHPYFPSDVALVFGIAGAILSVRRATSGEASTMTVLAFLDRAYALPGDLVILSVTFPLASSETTVLDSFKVMSRHANSHALVNAAFRLELSDDVDDEADEASASPTIASASALVGNISQGPLLCPRTAVALTGQPLNVATFKRAASVFSAEVAAAMDDGPADGTAHFVVEPAAYRQGLAESLLYKFILGAIVRTSAGTLPADFDPRWLSAAAHYERPISTGKPSFSPPPASFAPEAPLGEPIKKIEGPLQASRERAS